MENGGPVESEGCGTSPLIGCGGERHPRENVGEYSAPQERRGQLSGESEGTGGGDKRLLGENKRASRRVIPAELVKKETRMEQCRRCHLC